LTAKDYPDSAKDRPPENNKELDKKDMPTWRIRKLSAPSHYLE